MKDKINYLGMDIDGTGYRADLSRLKLELEKFCPKTRKASSNLLGTWDSFDLLSQKSANQCYQLQKNKWKTNGKITNI